MSRFSMPRRGITTVMLCLALTGAAPTVNAVFGLDPAAVSQAQSGTPAAIAPQFRSAHGITVTGQKALSDRTLRVTYTDPAIGSGQHITRQARGLSAVVTLPLGYRPDRTYPVLYLLHGHQGDALSWWRSMNVENITAGQDVIVVTPEGGISGWYTDWAVQPDGPANWETHHIDHVIPFIEANLPVYRDRAHRAIAGASMGGYGALHYAYRHPELFAHVSSYSGVFSLDDPAVQRNITRTASGRFNLQPADGTGPFGLTGTGPTSGWTQQNPINHAQRYRGMGVSIYTGGQPGDHIEVLAQASGRALDQRLRSLGIRHTYVDLGKGGWAGGLSCDGHHNGKCMSLYLALDLPAIMKTIGTNPWE